MDLYNKIGIPFHELLNMPRYEIIRIFEVVDEFNEVKYRIEAEERRKLLDAQKRNNANKQGKTDFPHIPEIPNDF